DGIRDFHVTGVQTCALPICFIAFDTETTGFDRKEDRILSLGAVEIINKTIKANNSFEIYIKQDIFKPETVKIHGILKEGDLVKRSEERRVGKDGRSRWRTEQ